jgi:alpha-tubulin suppressor-like RCC1 family protein
LTKSHHLFAWGSNRNGQLGTNDLKEQHSSPALVPFPDQEIPTRVCCGSYFSAVITATGKVYTWGCGNEGKLGLGDKIQRTAPTRVEMPFSEPVVDIACGMTHVLVLTRKGEVYGWGDNLRAQIHGEDAANILTPMLIPLPGDIKRVFAGSQQSTALTRKGELLVWGRNEYGALGSGSDIKKVITPRILFPSGIRAAALGWGHGLAITDEPSVIVWGVGDDGELGNGGSTDIFFPAKLDPKSFPQEKRVAGIATGFTHSFFILEDGTLMACGDGSDGALGLPEKGDRNTPQEVKLKVRVPRDLEDEWREIFFWLFLGKADENSIFHVLPIEVLFHFTFVFPNF